MNKIYTTFWKRQKDRGNRKINGCQGLGGGKRDENLGYKGFLGQ